ncbi:MAG: hypothetical protein K8S16_18155 [Bacteroidales bacterium]|nr:hypothetical protein [Bacteroidales bacterium]
MKKLILTTILLFFVTITFSDKYITRGPNPGEIYFRGATYTDMAIYYSTDYGMTAVCVDSTLFQEHFITAGITPGVLYYISLFGALHISYNYGFEGDWIHRTNLPNIEINSGVQAGYIHSSITKHSEDYGVPF